MPVRKGTEQVIDVAANAGMPPVHGSLDPREVPDDLHVRIGFANAGLLVA